MIPYLHHNINTSKNEFKKNFYRNFFVKSPLLNFISIKFFKKFLILLSHIFQFNNNILFVDFDINYNYLPISNKLLFNRSSRKLYKILKYFKVSTIFYLNTKGKPFFLKKFFNFKCLNVSLNKNFDGLCIDTGLDNNKTDLINYMVYIYTMNIYLFFKNS